MDEDSLETSFASQREQAVSAEAALFPEQLARDGGEHRLVVVAHLGPPPHRSGTNRSK